MADGSSLDELEYRNLQGVVASVEALIPFATPDAKCVYERILSSAQVRLGFLEKMIAEHKTEVERQQWEQAASAALAAKETKLSTSERQTYRGFLEESYFTKKDFGKLDEFYAHSYDRLSENGKDEMSKRVDEAIRRGEFKLGDLPKNALAKEINHRAAKAERAAFTPARFNESQENSNHPATPAQSLGAKEIDLGSVDLGGVELADATPYPNPASIPDVSNSKIIHR